MATQALTKTSEKIPSVFDDFFKPWSEWFGNTGSLWGRVLSVPAVNVTENKDSYQVSLAAPGLKKEDFKINVEGNMLTVSAQSEETKEENEKAFTRKEYNFSSFSRSFTLPDEINQEKIGARYEDGILNLVLPRKENGKTTAAKQIAVQ